MCGFKYNSHENSSKPTLLKSTLDKLSGNASQNWLFLRFFPLYNFNKIKDVDDAVWKLVLILRNIVQLVVSPCLSKNDIVHLHYLVKKYLELRILVFDDVPLRPKHHYLLHCARLILEYGPIIHCSTIRFESKQTYFKRVIRAKKCFINVCSSLAFSHQYLKHVCFTKNYLLQI